MKCVEIVIVVGGGDQGRRRHFFHNYSYVTNEFMENDVFFSKTEYAFLNLLLYVRGTSCFYGRKVVHTAS